MSKKCINKIFLKLSVIPFISFLTSTDPCWGAEKPEGSSSPYPSLQIAKEFGYEPTPSELAGTSSYQDADWKAAEHEIANSPTLYQKQYEAIRDDMDQK